MAFGKLNLLKVCRSEQFLSPFEVGRAAVTWVEEDAAAACHGHWLLEHWDGPEVHLNLKLVGGRGGQRGGSWGVGELIDDVFDIVIVSAVHDGTDGALW